MRAILFTRLGLSSSVATQYSQPVSMEGANALSIDFVVFALTGTGTPTVTCAIELSNDMENWTAYSGSMTGNTATAIGYSLTSTVASIPTAYVRLKVALTGTSPAAIVSAGLNTVLL